MAIRDSRVLDCGGERVPVELRMAPRAREAADVDERPRFRGRKHLEELLDRPGAVPDGEDAHEP